jgi:two-component system sensor histidine kinase CiaH
VTVSAPRTLRRASIRVALAATALVAIAYLVVAVAVVAFVTRDLTAQIDHRLAESVGRIASGGPGPGGGAFPPPPEPGRPFGGPQLLVWTVNPDGTVVSDSDLPVLPDTLRDVTGPQTVTVSGSELRVMGASVGAARVVVGQTMDSVSQARSTVIVAELVIAPVLLAIVFLGAVAIGRRVAAPIERARRRQLDFTADASHELRTPLSVIEANTSLALASDRDVAWYRTAFARVDGEAKRMRRLVDDLLWLARFDSANEPGHPEPIDLGVLATGTADRFAAIAEARGLRLDVEVPADGAVIAAQADWIDRLVGVLLDNACKYSPPGGAVAVTVTADGARVQLTVDDAGPGIPESERGQVFDRFHRATDSGAGAGLGLAIGDAIVRATGGRWRLDTSPAGGARMAVSWSRASV